MLRMLATVTALTVVATASADGTASHYLWNWGTLPDSGEEFYTFRLQIEVTDTPYLGPDDWTAAGLDVDLTGGVFYQDAYGANPPNPGFFPPFPDLEYDSYYTSPSDYPNDEYDGAIVGIASTDDTDTVLNTDWFDTVDSGNGEFVIAQITVLPTSTGWIGNGHLMYALRNSGGQIFDYYFTLVPEPGTLALLALGGLAVMRRRR